MTNDSPSTRRARVVLLGEFSAGKSTLANALLGTDASPIRVTATHVPPLWYIHGDGPPTAIGRDGEEMTPINGDIAALSLSEVQHIRVPLQSDLLTQVDVLDMPGSSDPNLDPDIWTALLPQADFAIWCTPANQAWRQSEAALWQDMPDRFLSRSLLAITRMDKVTGETDRSRLLQRIAKETSAQFREVCPLGLTSEAISSDDPALQEAAGLTAFRRALSDAISQAPARAEPTSADVVPLKTAQVPADTARPREGQVLPRRVTSGARRRSQRGSGNSLL